MCSAIFICAALIESACGTSANQPSNPGGPTSPPDVTVTLLPATANLSTGAAQVFTATVSGAGNSTTAVTWSVNGIAGGNSTVGTITASGVATATYAAPLVPPSPSTVTITAISVADNSKSASATATIACAAQNLMSPPSANVALVQTQAFTASFCLAINGSLAWDVNGTAGGSSALGTIVATGSATALYTAPADLPVVNPVTIYATANSTGSGSATVSATVTLTSNVSVSVLPSTATLTPNQRTSFAATVANTSDATVNWSVNGIPNGNFTVGQICQAGTGPCVAPIGPISESISFIAPASVPAINPVILTATSFADSSRSGTAIISISSSSPTIAVVVSPLYAFVPPSTGTPSTQQFFATVTGVGNTTITWTVQSAVAGQGCGGAACGSISTSGLYAAPAVAPSPNAISVIATSQANHAKSASAAIAVTSGPAIEVILPSSVTAGAVLGFPLEVQGVNFVAGNGSSSSVILLNGVSRSTTCSTAAVCVTALNPADLQSAGVLTLQVRNPGTSSPLSNVVPFVIVPFDVSVDTIALNSAQPVATGKNIVVVEPTTAAVSSPLNVDFIGLLTGGNTCGVQGSPLTVTRPSSGSSVVSICVHGNGLDPTMSFVFSGPGGAPNPGDIGVTASAIAGLFPNLIELDLQLTNATLPGLRTLFITSLDNDRAVATGMLEVK